MERACLYQTLADAYARMVVRPSPSPSDRPLGLRARGPSKCHNCMTNPADVAVGSAEVLTIDARSARNASDHPASVRTARATAIAHHSVSSRGWLCRLHHVVLQPRHSRTRRTSPNGVGSVSVTTWDTKR